MVLHSRFLPPPCLALEFFIIIFYTIRQKLRKKTLCGLVSVIVSFLISLNYLVNCMDASPVEYCANVLWRLTLLLS